MNAPQHSEPDRLASLVEWFETLTPQSVARTAEFYSPDAYFKDPFNEVTGAKQIERIYAHLFRQVLTPRFRVRERISNQGDGGTHAMLVWELHFRADSKAPATVVRGASHLRFNPEGMVIWHRDYWDTAEELYCRAPGLGMLMRWLRGRLQAPQR